VLENPANEDVSWLSEQELDALADLGIQHDGHLLGATERHRIIGARLYRTLFPASEDSDRDVRGALRSALNRARENDRPVSIQLRFDAHDADLCGLPWELVCDERGEHLIAEPRLVQLTRYIAFGHPVAPFPVSGRLEVLAITSRPSNLQTLARRTEAESLRTVFRELETAHLVRIRSLEPPSIEALRCELDERPYHVIHFDGHGAFARRCPRCGVFNPFTASRCQMTLGCGGSLDDAQPEGCLAFESGAPDRRADLIGAGDLAQKLAGRHILLFVACACQSGTVGGASVFSGLGPRLLTVDVPAVVAMQFPVSLDEAIIFTRAFYTALRRGDPVALAAGSGRDALKPRGLWYIPAVYLRSRDGQGHLFRRGSWALGQFDGADGFDWEKMRPPDAAPFKFLSPYEVTDHVIFAGREGDTERLLSRLLQERITILYGPSGVGKTSLVNAGLTPELLQRRYFVLTVREYGDPVAMLRREAETSPALALDLNDDDSLLGVCQHVAEAAGRPVVVIFDQLETYLRSANEGQLRAFADELVGFTDSQRPPKARLLLVLQADALGVLQSIQARMPNIFHRLEPLDPLTKGQARQAITKALAWHKPPMQIEKGLLKKEVLPALEWEPDSDSINPVHLQIVCTELYRRALEAGDAVLGLEHCPPEGPSAILRDYLSTTLATHYHDPDIRNDIRRMLQEMVSGAGERRWMTPEALAVTLGVEGATVQAHLDELVADGLVTTQPNEQDVTSYTLTHRVLAEEVSSWFDPEEARDRCAAEALRRAWEDWSASRARGGSELLVAPDRLCEIALRRQGVPISAPEMLLLLRSAVRYRNEVETWTGVVAADEITKSVLRQIQNGVVADAEAVDAMLALGLDPGNETPIPLSQAAVNDANGVVRHTAALAVGALGLDALKAALPEMDEAARQVCRWRPIQALAQVRAAGLSLPQLSLGRWVAVSTWLRGIRLFDARWALAAEAAGATIGGALGLLLAMVLGYAVLGDLRSDTLKLSLMFLFAGTIAGFSYSAGYWTLDVLGHRRAVRIFGAALGFTAGVVIILLTALSWSPLVPVSAMVAGAAIAAGATLLTRGHGRDAVRWAALGGALGGALSFALTGGIDLWLGDELRGWLPQPAASAALVTRLPFGARVAGDERQILNVLFSALAGLAMGAGLAGGVAAGDEIYRHSSLGSSDLVD
jgi:DNA-binding MarR family transcriptional regulator